MWTGQRLPSRSLCRSARISRMRKASPLAPVPRIRNTHAARRSEFEHALEESLAAFEDLGDSRGVAEVLLEQGRVAHAQGNDTRAPQHCAGRASPSAASSTTNPT